MFPRLNNCYRVKLDNMDKTNNISVQLNELLQYLLNSREQCVLCFHTTSGVAGIQFQVSLLSEPCERDLSPQIASFPP